MRARSIGNTTVIASEAKQSIASPKKKAGLLRFARNDDLQGAGNAGGARRKAGAGPSKLKYRKQPHAK
jgi:hypothetical protein